MESLRDLLYANLYLLTLLMNKTCLNLNNCLKIDKESPKLTQSNSTPLQAIK